MVTIAPGRGRKPTYNQEVRAHILRTVQRCPDRQVDGTATWYAQNTGTHTPSRARLAKALCSYDPSSARERLATPISRAAHGGRSELLNECAKRGVVIVHDPQTQGKKALIEQAYQTGERAGVMVRGLDEAGPYQAIPQPRASWQPEGKAALQPHEYIRGGTANLLTLFRPATGALRAKGVLSAPNVVLHPWQRAGIDAGVGQDREQAAQRTFTT